MQLKGMLQDSHSLLKEYKKQIETYRSEIEDMRHKLETVNTDNMNHVLPKLQYVSDQYNHSIALQRKENQALQQRLTDLKKDKAQMHQQVDLFEKLIQQMQI